MSKVETKESSENERETFLKQTKNEIKHKLKRVKYHLTYEQ